MSKHKTQSTKKGRKPEPEKKENIMSPQPLEKDFYSTEELAALPWFPVKSAGTIRALIKSGRLQAINISAVEGIPRYRISKEAVAKFFLFNK